MKFKKIVNKKSDWQTSGCTHKIFQMEYICNHIITLALLYKMADIQITAKEILFGEKRKPRRPSKAKKH